MIRSNGKLQIIAYMDGFKAKCAEHGMDYRDDVLVKRAEEMGYDVTEKKAFAISGALLAALAMYSMYGAGKNGYSAYKNFRKGDNRQAWKDVGWAGVNALGVIPGLGFAAKPLAMIGKASRIGSLAGRAGGVGARATKALAAMSPANRVASWGSKARNVSPWLGGDTTAKALQYGAKGMGQTVGRGLDALAKGERGAFALAGRHAPNATRNFGRGMDKLVNSRVFQNKPVQWARKNWGKAMVGEHMAGTAGNGMFGAEGTGVMAPNTMRRPYVNPGVARYRR